MTDEQLAEELCKRGYFLSTNEWIHWKPLILEALAKQRAELRKDADRLVAIAEEQGIKSGRKLERERIEKIIDIQWDANIEFYKGEDDYRRLDSAQDSINCIRDLLKSKLNKKDDGKE